MSETDFGRGAREEREVGKCTFLSSRQELLTSALVSAAPGALLIICAQGARNRIYNTTSLVLSSGAGA